MTVGVETRTKIGSRPVGAGELPNVLTRLAVRRNLALMAGGGALCPEQKCLKARRRSLGPFSTPRLQARRLLGRRKPITKDETPWDRCPSDLPGE